MHSPTRQLMWLALGYLAGLIAGSHIHLPIYLVILITLTGILASLRWKWFYPLVVSSVVIGVGFVNAQLASILASGPYDRHQASNIYEAWIDSSPEHLPDGTRLTVRLISVRDGELMRSIEGRARLFVITPRPLLEKSLIYGDKIRFRARLHEPNDFNNPGGFKYSRFLRGRGIDLVSTINDPRWVIKVGPVEGHTLRRWVEMWRETIASNSLGDRMTPQRADIMGVTRALLIGDGSQITPEVEDSFRKSGLMHILVISGLQIAFVLATAFWPLKFILARMWNLPLRVNIIKLAAIGSLIAIWIYTYLTGAGVATVRAAIMASAYLVSVILDRRHDIITTLSLAALVILVISPLAIYEVSFQLSFASVLAIVLIMPRFLAAVDRWSLTADKGRRMGVRIIRLFIDTIAVTIAATAGVVPLLLYYFHTSSLAGVLANIFAVPYAGFVLTPLGIIAALVSLINPLAPWAVELFGWFAAPLLEIAKVFSRLAAPVTISFTPSLIQIILWYGMLALVLSRRIKYALGCAILLAGLIIGGKFMDGKLTVAFLDVGQGASVVVRFPTGRAMIVDGGGIKSSDFDIGKFVIGPYLWREGITKVDWLVATHPHPDHYKGLKFLAEDFRPAAIFYNGGETEDAERSEWDEFVNSIKKTGAPMKILREGPFLEEGGVQVDVLSPPKDGIPEAWSCNSGSIAMRISYKDVSFLLTGDLQADTEDWLLSRHKLAADVLQVPHHGSSTSTSEAFLEAVNPKFAVIQAGRHNIYGFPHQETLDILKSNGVEFYRTDRDGAVIFKTDGTSIKVKNMP